jgi:hypothetical protein
MSKELSPVSKPYRQSPCSFLASYYAGDATMPIVSCAALLAGSNAMYAPLRLFGILLHVGSLGKKNKT